MDLREKLYCCEMMLGELKKRHKSPGDTRSYLSLDDNDAQVLRQCILVYQFLLNKIGNI